MTKQTDARNKLRGAQWETSGQTDTREGQHIIIKNSKKNKQASYTSLGDRLAESYVETGRRKNWKAEN